MIIKAYHLSRSKNRGSIKEKGLITKEKSFGHIQYMPRIFISIKKTDLAFDFVDYENVDCWEIDVSHYEIKKDPFSGSKNHFFIERCVAPSDLKLIESY